MIYYTDNQCQIVHNLGICQILTFCDLVEMFNFIQAITFSSVAHNRNPKFMTSNKL